jgi:uncharacterized DUF497 family protein
MEYEWDRDKAGSNLSKRGIDFRDTAEALEDPYRLEDPDPYEYEERTRVLCLYTTAPGFRAEPSEGMAA